MACYHPLPGWYGKTRNEKTGRRPIVFNFNEGFKDRPLPIPCGKCIGCKLERARQWAVRCMHEASLYESNCFVTLTYSDEKMPPDGSLNPRDFVLFMKRLRKRYDHGVRFFQCGEYGENTKRPHHHCLLFNMDFLDKRLLRGGATATPLYRSDELDELWGLGHANIGTATFESAGYIARYTLKKVVGPEASDWYQGKVPEYLTMSRRPGVGSAWLKEFFRDVYPSDELIVNGKVSMPTRFYDDMAMKLDKRMLERVKRKRRARGKVNPDGTGKRLLVREEVKTGSVAFLAREMENTR